MHTGVHALLTDLAGAPTELLDPATGVITGTVTTTLFGATRTAGTTTPHRFTGQHHDPETGLHYNRHRYYNPHTTTYTTPDPLGQAPNPDSNHAYVHNPLTWVDPLGLKKCINAGPKNTHVYRLVDQNGRTTYVGITKNPEARAFAHQLDPTKNGTFTLLTGETTGQLTRYQARGVEQSLIERIGLPNLDNRINSIASRRSDLYPQATEFGSRWLDTHVPASMFP